MCTGVMLASGASKTYTVVFVVGAPTGNITVCAIVNPTSPPDPNMGNNTACITTTVVFGPPLEPPSVPTPECTCPEEEGEDVPIFSAETESSADGTVHLNSGRFELRLPRLEIPGIGSSFGFRLTHLSGVTDGSDVPAFQSPQQARIVITNNKGDSNPDNDDVAVLTGTFIKQRFQFKQRTGNTIFYYDSDGATVRLTKDAVLDEYTLTSPNQHVIRFFGFNTSGVALGRLKSHSDADGNQFAYSYSQFGSEWHLTTETDTNGRTINYSYTLVSGKYV